MLANDNELKKLESESVCDDEILKKNEKKKKKKKKKAMEINPIQMKKMISQ